MVALVVGAGAVYGDHRWELAQQRGDYEAGHAAYLRADCAAALPRLRATQGDHLDRSVAARAHPDAAACEEYALAQTLARGRSPRLTISTYLAFLAHRPPGPLVDDARQRVRAALRADIATGRPTAKFCQDRDELTDSGVVRMQAGDDLAAPWLAACATTLAAQDDGLFYARRALAELQTTFPTSKEARATVGDLVRDTARFTADSREERTVTDLAPVGQDRTLNGRAELTLYNGTTWPLDLTISDPRPHFEHLTACRPCEKAPDAPVCDPKPSWTRTTITVVPGRRPLQFYLTAPSGSDKPDEVSWGTPDFAPNGVYVYCIWD